MDLLERLKAAALAQKRVKLTLKDGSVTGFGALFVGENLVDASDIIVAIQSGTSMEDFPIGDVQDFEEAPVN